MVRNSGNKSHGNNLSRNGLADPQFLLDQDLSNLDDDEGNHKQDTDHHTGQVEFLNEILTNQSAQEGVVLFEKPIQALKGIPQHIRNIAALSVAEQCQERLIGHINAQAVQHHVRKSPEGVHARQRRDKGRYAHFCDPETLEGTYGQADREHCQNCDPHVTAAHHQSASDCSCEADHGSDGQVDITAGQDTHQHTGRQNKHVSIFCNQTRNIGRQEDQSSFALIKWPQGENDSYDHQRDRHRVLLEESTKIKLLLVHDQSPLPALRIAAMMLSWVASSAFISPIILPSFIM